jgi:tRNA(Ser,Leu) C12 N-acetylase TAN1
MAKLVVTSRGWEQAGQTLRALRRMMPAARVHRTRFRGVLLVDAEGERDALRLAETVNRECAACTGHATAVLAEVESNLEQIREAARQVGSAQIGEHETFCFRLVKRGAHRLDANTPTVEDEIGGAIWQELERHYGKPPQVDLTDPDVRVIAEVLGPTTAVGIVRKAWRTPAQPASA